MMSTQKRRVRKLTIWRFSRHITKSGKSGLEKVVFLAQAVTAFAFLLGKS